MRNTPLSEQIHPLCWAVALFAVIGGMVGLCSAAFAGTFRDYVPVTLVSDRTGLVMESGAKVKMRGVQVGRVAGIDGGAQSATLRLEIFPDARLCTACQRRDETGASNLAEDVYCPRCGSPMLVKPATGRGIARYVWVCSQYPSCRGK